MDQPLVIPITIVAVGWKWIYNPAVGPINLALRAIGLQELALPWLYDSSTALTAIILTSTWHGVGQWMLLMSAGFTRIPDDYPEAAKIEGATDWQVFRYITLPLMWEVLRVLLVLWIMQALQAFTFFYIMGTGLTWRATSVMATYVYRITFGRLRWAYGMALATTMLVMIFALSLLVYRTLVREPVEY
jgi:ABC-type sugar transport system permease subunit